jgi:very-short-patch-repair endonuclease
MTGRTRPLDLVPGLRELARAQRGVVRRDQLRELGVASHHVAAQVRAQRWQRIGSRVVVLATGVLTRSQRRAVGIAHAGAGSALAGLTGLEELGLEGWPRDRAHVLVSHGRLPPSLPGVVVHQTRTLAPHDLLTDRWPACTTAARAAVDAASWELHPRTASGLVLAVVQQGLASGADILEVLDRAGPLRHRALLRSVLADEGADSLAELDVVRLLHSLGLYDIHRQVGFDTPLGRGFVDIVVRLPDGRLLAIEVDGPHHDDPAQRETDAAKDAALIAAGYQVLHIPVWLLRTDPARVRAQLEAIAIGARRSA